jgi:hypothetical protein
MVEFEKPITGLIEDPNEWRLYLLRTTRNTYLNYTDKYLLSDNPITPENLEIIKSYRQMLREFININKDLILSGELIEIPEIPVI